MSSFQETLSHTPGPWVFERGGGHAANRIVGSDSVQVNGWAEPRGGVRNASYSDRVCENLGNPDLPGPAANAALICAAPDLLALARKYASECGNCNGRGFNTQSGEPYTQESSNHEVIGCDDCADIREVIAKAVGRG